MPPDLRRLGVTTREMDVFALVGRGLSNAHIAAELYISPKTVETHTASLITKTGVSGRRQLVALAAGHNETAASPALPDRTPSRRATAGSRG